LPLAIWLPNKNCRDRSWEAKAMDKVKLSQRDALMIEVLRANGISDQDLLQRLKQGDIQSFQDIGGGDFDYAELLSFAQENWEVLEQAVLHGYEIKFNTISGIRYLLKVKFNKHPDTDYQNRGDHLDQLALTKDEFAALRSVLSRYWSIAEQANGGYKIELVKPD
jgi:hypothetical protein